MFHHNLFLSSKLNKLDFLNKSEIFPLLKKEKKKKSNLAKEINSFLFILFMKLIVNLILVSFITYYFTWQGWGTSPQSRPCYVHHDDGDFLILIIFVGVVLGSQIILQLFCHNFDVVDCEWLTITYI